MCVSGCWDWREGKGGAVAGLTYIEGFGERYVMAVGIINLSDHTLGQTAGAQDRVPSAPARMQRMGRLQPLIVL